MVGFVRKWLAYHVKDYADPLAIRHLEEVSDVWEQHSAELDEFWRLTSPDERASLVAAFLEDLRREWPRESSELYELDREAPPDAMSEGFIVGIQQAYVAGFMRGWTAPLWLDSQG